MIWRHIIWNEPYIFLNKLIVALDIFYINIMEIHN